MSTKEEWPELFREYVRNIHLRRNPFQLYQVIFHPLTDNMLFDVNVARAWRGLLRLSHHRTCVVILIHDRCCMKLKTIVVSVTLMSSQKEEANERVTRIPLILV